MAMQKLLLSDDYLDNDDIRQLLLDDTTFGANNVHEGGLMSNQLIADNPTIGLLNYQNHCIPQQNHPQPILGQLGLNQRVTEYQKTFICSSNRVSSCRVTGIHPMEAQPMLCHGDVFQVTEVISDHVITMVSTKERVSISNHRFVFPNQSVFKNMNPPVVNRAPEVFTASEYLMDPGHQTPTGGLRPSNFVNFYEFQAKNNGFGVASSPFDQMDHNSRCLRLSESEINQAPIPVYQAVPDIGERSHLHKYQGPYKCVKCGEMFITPLCYEAHMISHYQSETVAERLKTQASKYKENLHLVQASNGVSFKGHGGRKPKMAVKTKAAVKKEQTDDPMAVKQEFSYRGVVIKEEPN